MIRFIDLREQDIGYAFAFWDTTIDRFITVGGVQAWSDWKDFESDYDRGASSINLVRFRGLCPSWIFT